jgi:hypothetical protein
MVKIGKYEYFISDKPAKKLYVLVDGKKIYFGDTKYTHFKDATGLLAKSSNHGDEVRRKSYLVRASKIKNKAGALTVNDPSSPNYHAIRILWGG